MPEPQGEDQPITDEEREAVWKLLFEMLRVDDPTIDDSTKAFRYQFISPDATITITFEPDARFLNWAIRTSHRVIRETLEKATQTLLAEGKIDSDIASDPNLKMVFESKNPEGLAATFAYITMQNLIPKMKSAFAELGQESIKILEGIMFLGMERSGFDEKTGFQIPDMTKHLTDLSKDMAGRRRKQLIEQINVFAGTPRLELMPQVYPKLHKIWRQVKKIYAANDESETWRDMVKAKYPDLPFDDDLLTRVAGNTETLPDEIQIKLDETDGNDTPSSIALEHAARLLGAAPYQHSTRHYYRLAGRQKKTTDQTEE
jgi:hypothetical protein